MNDQDYYLDAHHEALEFSDDIAMNAERTRKSAAKNMQLLNDAKKGTGWNAF